MQALLVLYMLLFLVLGTGLSAAISRRRSASSTRRTTAAALPASRSTTIASFSRAAPKPVNATIVGLYCFSVFFGSVASGGLGGLYERMSPARFWAIHAVICAAGGAILLAYRPHLNRALKAEAIVATSN